MRSFLTFVALSVGYLSLIGASHAADKVTLQGQWKVGAYHRNGEVVAEPSVDSVVFAADKLVFTLKANPVGERSFTLDESQNPKHIDIVKGDEISPGIYAINEDSLLLCYSIPGSGRPTEFAAEKDDQRTLLILKSATLTPNKTGLGHITLFVLGSVVGIWIWRKGSNAINQRLVNVAKHLRKGDFSISPQDLRTKRPSQLAKEWIKRFHTGSRLMFWKSAILPTLSTIVAVGVVRYVDNTMNLGTQSFVIFLVVAGVLRVAGHWLNDQFLSLRIKDEGTDPAIRLLYLLEKPRCSLVFKLEFGMFVAFGIVFCFINPDQLLALF